MLAVIALTTRRTGEHPIRWFLAAWCAAMIGASFGAPGIGRAVYSVPVVAQIIVSRYAAPSWALAAVILAALAIDDWHHGRAQWRRVLVALAFVASAGAAALAIASGVVTYLWAQQPGYAAWFVLSVAGAVAVLLCVVALLATRPHARRGLLLALLLAGESVTLFTVTRFAGLRHAALDLGPVDFLRQHLGLQRAYAFGTLIPNYPAYFQIASINSYYLPVPHLWAD